MTFWVPYHSSLPVLGLDNLLFANVIIRHLHYIWQPSESDTIHKGFNCMIGMACIVLPLLIMRTCAQPWGWVGAWWSIANHVNLGTNVPSPICKYESNNLFLPTDLSISPCFWTEVKGFFKSIYIQSIFYQCVAFGQIIYKPHLCGDESDNEELLNTGKRNCSWYYEIYTNSLADFSTMKDII